MIYRTKIIFNPGLGFKTMLQCWIPILRNTACRNMFVRFVLYWLYLDLDPVPGSNRYPDLKSGSATLLWLIWPVLFSIRLSDTDTDWNAATKNPPWFWCIMYQRVLRFIPVDQVNVHFCALTEHIFLLEYISDYNFEFMIEFLPFLPGP